MKTKTGIINSVFKLQNWSREIIAIEDSKWKGSTFETFTGSFFIFIVCLCLLFLLLITFDKSSGVRHPFGGHLTAGDLIQSEVMARKDGSRIIKNR
ncbi:MAG: hypothetical protein J5848_04485 [Bacteroidales bacterium]|nr:hypothetical protein [Bacteroidales bacterium]